eukprot:scaffold542677_cov46-Prasinocladus_malaysianus.AAC.1
MTVSSQHSGPNGYLKNYMISPREIDPFRVAEFIAHEVEVALAAQGSSEESDHLVQGNAAVNDRTGWTKARSSHEVIHVLVHEPESDSFVSDQSLIVTLSVAHTCLSIAAVGHGVANVAHVPSPVVLVACKESAARQGGFEQIRNGLRGTYHLKDLDPLVCNGHLQA